MLDASDPGLKTVEVEQLGELRVLWINRTFSTFLTVTEDQRTPDCLRTSFELLRSVRHIERMCQRPPCVVVLVGEWVGKGGQGREAPRGM